MTHMLGRVSIALSLSVFASAVRLSADDGRVKLEVSDNGCGFKTGHVQSGMGLNNMRARAATLQARLNISSAVGSGTLIQVITDTSQEVADDE